MANRFEISDHVFVEADIPDRYLDRTGVVTGTVPRGRGVQYLVSFPGRRATPFRVSGSALKVAFLKPGYKERYTRYARYTR